MQYVTRKPLTVLGRTYRAGDRIDGAEVPGVVLTKLVSQHRITVDETTEHDVAAPPRKRGRPPKAALAAAEGD